ncbi:MAG TPA: hypothetical protein DEA47_02525 [Peptococcaceae bacterium]|nr:MAG: hypothetical protein XD50_0053 [Clostridia bacterium 41_269]HBT20235.1 hypothetical protein [Peptococcaceae bacterium]
MEIKETGLIRLYMANLEQHFVLKRAFALALILILTLNFLLIFLSGNVKLNLLLFTVLIYAGIYFVLGEFITGFIAFRSPEVIAGRVSRQRLNLKDDTDAGELIYYAFKKFRNGNIEECREALSKFFALKYLPMEMIRFAYLILADSYLEEDKSGRALKILKDHIVKKDSSDSISQFIYGRAFFEQGIYDKALQALEQSWEHFLSRNFGVPNIFPSRLKNSELKTVYRGTLEVFIPYYLAKAYLMLGNRKKAADFFRTAVVLCRNKHLRPLLKKSFNSM